MNKNLESLLALADVLCTDSIQKANWEYWVSELDNVLSKQHAPTLTVSNVDRKWELVSAYQKSVRRGNTSLSLRLVSAMESMPTERQYMWRRICTTAAEDVGGGSPQVMKFVLACSSIWTPSQLTDTSLTLGLWGFLTDLMCATGRSRLYCQYVIMNDALNSKDRQYQIFDSCDLGKLLKAVLAPKVVPTPDMSEGDQWLIASNWRAEGMSVGPLWQSKIKAILTPSNRTMPAPVLLCGLPDYAYDMHTQVGKTTCFRMCGLLNIRQFFLKNLPISKPDALGWAMFFEEGGIIEQGVRSHEIDEFEQLVVAERHSLSVDAWMELRKLVREAMESGQVNEIRQHVMLQKGY